MCESTPKRHINSQLDSKEVDAYQLLKTFGIYNMMTIIPHLGQL